MRTYAVGDIHGCLGQLEQLIRVCEQDTEPVQKRFVFLGDYIDRGSASRGVLDLLIKMQSEGQGEVICLMGNHEQLALAALEDPEAELHWYDNGGLETLRSYRIASPADLPPGHVNFLRSLPTHFDDGLRYFAHAGVHPSRPLQHQNPHDLLWIREPFLSFDGEHGRLVVHGHTPLRDGRPDQRANRLNIDTGAVFGGPLTAAIFENETAEPIGFVQAR
jgi:serine/threonine protein phosphatase 1